MNRAAVEPNSSSSLFYYYDMLIAVNLMDDLGV